MYLIDLIQALDQELNDIRRCDSFESVASRPAGFWCPDIKRVTFNGDTTIVFFVDGTYAVVKCSGTDTYDRKTAIVYAMTKRMLGKLGKTDKNNKFHANEVDGSGIGSYLQKVVDAGFDQKLEEKNALANKRKAHAEHEARQKAQQKAAFDKRVEARAKQILLERAATDRANEIEEENRKNPSMAFGCPGGTCVDPCPCDGCIDKMSCDGGKCVDNNCPDGTCVDPCPGGGCVDTYVKPNKPFSKFTHEEKKAYWRYHNAKRKANKK